MAEQKIIISIQVNSGEAAKTNKALKVTKDNFDKLTAAEQEAIVADKQLSLAAKQLDKDLTNQAAAANAAAAATDNMRATSGLNNAIIMETSRLASDASFGFTAIANNLSQLVNLVQMNAKATGSFKSAIAGLFTAQAAFLVGIQLLITYGDDLYKMFLKNSSAAIDLFKVFKDAGAEVSSTSGKFETYIRTLQDSNKSQEEQRKAVNALNKEFPDYISQLERADLTLEDVANKTEEATRQNTLYRESLKKLALARAAQNKIEEESAAIIQANIDFEGELRRVEAAGAEDVDGIAGFSMKDAKLSVDAYKEAFDEISKMNLTTQQKDDELIKRKKENRKIAAGEALSSLYDELQEEIKVRDENIQRLVKYTIIETDTVEDGIGKRKKAYKEGDLDFEKERQKSTEREIKSFLQKETAKVNAEFKGIRDRATLKQQEFVEDEGRRLDAFLRSTDDENAKADAIKRSDEAIKKSKDELSSYIVRLNTEQAAKITKVELETTRRIIELDQKKTDTLVAHQDKLAFLDGKYTFDTLQRNIQRLESEISLEEQLALNHEIGTEKRAQADLRLAELRRNLSSERIELEKQEFDFVREQIEKVAGALEQTLEVTAHNQTVRLEENYAREIEAAEGNSERQQQLQQELAEKKDKIQRKQFNVDKAMKIGRALMDTYESSTLAYGSQLIIGDPSSTVRAQIARAIAIAAGLANVANIARQKYQSSLGAGGG